MTTHPPTLKLSDHAEARALERGIRRDAIYQVLKTGARRDCGVRVLHYDLRVGIGVVVDWRDMAIITVYHLNNHTRWLLHNGLPLPTHAAER